MKGLMKVGFGVATLTPDGCQKMDANSIPLVTLDKNGISDIIRGQNGF
jgi:hypothetical protein